MTSAREEEEEGRGGLGEGSEGTGDVDTSKAVREAGDGSQPGQLSLGTAGILESRQGSKGELRSGRSSGSVFLEPARALDDTLSGVSKKKKKECFIP